MYFHVKGKGNVGMGDIGEKEDIEMGVGFKRISKGIDESRGRRAITGG